MIDHTEIREGQTLIKKAPAYVKVMYLSVV